MKNTKSDAVLRPATASACTSARTNPSLKSDVLKDYVKFSNLRRRNARNSIRISENKLMTPRPPTRTSMSSLSNLFHNRQQVDDVEDGGTNRKSKFTNSQKNNFSKELEKKLDVSIISKRNSLQRLKSDSASMNKSNAVPQAESPLILSKLDMRLINIFRGVLRLYIRHRKKRLQANERETNSSRFRSNQQKATKEFSPMVSNVINRYQVSKVPSFHFFSTNRQPDGQNPATGLSKILNNSMYLEDQRGHRHRRVRFQKYEQPRTNERKSKLLDASQSTKHLNPSHEHKKRIAKKRSEIQALSKDFKDEKRQLNDEMEMKLAIRSVAREKLSTDKCLALGIDNSNLPSYGMQKEIYITRLREKKRLMDQKCQTLELLAGLVNRVEILQLITQEKPTACELRILNLFRQLVEKEVVLSVPTFEALVKQLSEEEKRDSKAQFLLQMIEKNARFSVKVDNNARLISYDYTGKEIVETYYNLKK